MTPNDELDELYAAAPEDFTALRKQLVAAAKKRGDADAAARIGGARRPTTAAWVVNAIVRADDSARRRLADLAEELRAAHASMDGKRIRELSGAQRRLVDELVRVGFAATGQKSPSAALRDDVVGTLQAAIADPDVADRLGTLAKAERWSGFGEFGAVTAVAGAKARKAVAPVPAKPADTDRGAVRAARTRRTAASAELDAARTAFHEAREAVVDARGRVATARRRYEKLLETLNAAELEVKAAEAGVETAEQSADEVADRVATANDELTQADRALRALN